MIPINERLFLSANQMASKSPFYYQITQTKEDFTDAVGLPKSIDLPLITLPPGTVLFRGMKVPNPAEVDARVFYKDYLGDPEGSKVCMRPTQNVFFYPFPYVAFGANQVGKTFDMMQMVVLVHPVTVICSISPSQWVRGMGQRYGGTAPYRRCDSFPLSCHPLTQAEKEGLRYDNCLSPEYQIRSGTRGWMALADLDSFNPDKPRGSTEAAPNSSMKLYIKNLEARKPGAGAELAAWSYTDAKRHHGFPEISLYPYKAHQGDRLLNRYCPNSETAIRLMAKEAAADNLNFLPIATFTRNGTIDMVNGFFTPDALGVSENSFSTPAADKQPVIEQKIGEYMDLLQTTGVKLPFFGGGKLSLDTRTGFYILPQVVPRNLMVPIPAEAPPASVGGGGSAAAASPTSQPYRFLTLGLDTAEAKKRALNYILIFRNAIPAKFMEKYGLDRGFGIRRAMVFDRPPVLPRVFQELGLDVPKEFKAGIARAAALFQKNSGAPKKTKVAAAAGAAAGVAAGAPATPQFGRTPEFGPSTPEFGEGGHTPEFGEGGHTPEFGGRTPEFGGRTPAYGPTTPTYAASPKYITVEEAREQLRAGKSFDSLRDKLSPTNLKKVAGMHKEFGFSPPFLANEGGGAPPYLAIGGTRKVKKSKGTKGAKTKTKGTRKVKTLESVAKLFHTVWKSVGKR
jgi:hypothetical protein